MTQLEPVTGSLVGVESGTLRLGAKRYSLTHLSSTDVFRSRHFGAKPAVIFGLILAGLIVIQFGRNNLAESRGNLERYATNIAGMRYLEAQAVHGKAVTELWFGVGLLVGAGVIALMVWLTPHAHHLMLSFASGEQHRIDFADRTACLAFCDQLNDAMRAAGQTTLIDARSLHVHLPNSPTLR